MTPPCMCTPEPRPFETATTLVTRPESHSRMTGFPAFMASGNVMQGTGMSAPNGSDMHSPAARDRTFEIVFDGGALGNPGRGYGSYEITSEGRVLRHRREEFGDMVTNNQAEYMTLIHALQWLADHLGNERSMAKVLVNGDSKLVLFQLLRKWKVKNEGLRPLHAEATCLVRQFFTVELVWHPRAKSVERLGH